MSCSGRIYDFGQPRAQLTLGAYAGWCVRSFLEAACRGTELADQEPAQA